MRCVSIEHKLGIHAEPDLRCSPSATTDGAIGYLVGEENRGLEYMFVMMNARALRRRHCRASASPSAPTSARSAYARERARDVPGIGERCRRERASSAIPDVRAHADDDAVATPRLRARWRT